MGPADVSPPADIRPLLVFFAQIDVSPPAFVSPNMFVNVSPIDVITGLLKTVSEIENFLSVLQRDEVELPGRLPVEEKLGGMTNSMSFFALKFLSKKYELKNKLRCLT